MKKIKHFLDLEQINNKELRSIIDLSKSYKQGITSGQDTHKGKTLGLIFEKPSTRTRVSFEIAMYQLGGNVSILEHEKISRINYELNPGCYFINVAFTVACVPTGIKTGVSILPRCV